VSLMPCVDFKVKWDKEKLESVLNSLPKSKVEYSMRLLESEVAVTMGIPFNEVWYGLDVIAREHMVASHLCRRWIEALATMEVKESG
jgi:hypothetical protein